MSIYDNLVSAGEKIAHAAQQLEQECHMLMAGWHSEDRDATRYIYPILTRISFDLRKIAWHSSELNNKKVEPIEIFEHGTGYEQMAGLDRDQLEERTMQFYSNTETLRKELQRILAVIKQFGSPPSSLTFLVASLRLDLCAFAIEYKRLTEVSLEPWLGK